MSRKVKGRRTGAPPPKEAWIWHTLELRRSKAWLGRSIGCVKLLEFLELEHLQHGANDNGRLHAPYSQLVAFGISRRTINASILEAEARGLLRVDRGGLKGRTLSEMNKFTLTYAWTREQRDGVWQWEDPTDDWKGRECDGLKTHPKPRFDGAKKDTDDATKPASISTTKDTVSVPQRTLPSVPQRTLPTPQVVEIPTTPRVSFVEHPSISGGSASTPLTASRVQELSAMLTRKGGRSALTKSAVASPPLQPQATNPSQGNTRHG